MMTMRRRHASLLFVVAFLRGGNGLVRRTCQPTSEEYDITCDDPDQLARRWHNTGLPRLELSVKLLLTTLAKQGAELSLPHTLLDYGCGEGVSTTRLKQAFTNTTVIGYDSDPGSVAASKLLLSSTDEYGIVHRVKGLHFIGNFSKRKLFDAVVCTNVISVGASAAGLAAKVDTLLSHVDVGGWVWISFKPRNNRRELLDDYLSTKQALRYTVLDAADYPEEYASAQQSAAALSPLHVWAQKLPLAPDLYSAP